jgi:hypothetical protein
MVVDYPLAELARFRTVAVMIRKSAEFHLGQPAGRRGAGEIPIRHVRLVRGRQA